MGLPGRTAFKTARGGARGVFYGSPMESLGMSAQGPSTWYYRRRPSQALTKDHHGVLGGEEGPNYEPSSHQKLRVNASPAMAGEGTSNEHSRAVDGSGEVLLFF